MENIFFITVPLPTPDGPDITASTFLTALFNVLYLFAYFFYLVLKLKPVPRYDYIVALGADGIALKKQKSLKKTLVMDVLQIPLSIVFSRLLNLYGAFLPDLSDQAMWLRLGSC